jgi:hypothetical protein
VGYILVVLTNQSSRQLLASGDDCFSPKIKEHIIMISQRKNRIKVLIRQTFWQLDDCSDRELTPILIRQFLANNVPHTLLEPFAINVTGGDWWERVEQLVKMFIEAKRHHA